jgi:hypothetical protein
MFRRAGTTRVSTRARRKLRQRRGNEELRDHSREIFEARERRSFESEYVLALWHLDFRLAQHVWTVVELMRSRRTRTSWRSSSTTRSTSFPPGGACRSPLAGRAPIAGERRP